MTRLLCPSSVPSRKNSALFICVRPKHRKFNRDAAGRSSLSLEKKQRAKQAITSIRDPESVVIHHKPLGILGTWQRYYHLLFTADVCDKTAQDVMLSRLTRSLSPAEIESCKGFLTLPECHAALLGMSHGKTPGSDGFPMEFFVSFWDILGLDFVWILNVAFESGQLSASQRRGLIIVLYKKGDRLETKNFHPISLLNVGYKIATRAISGQLLGVIGTVVGYDQTCGIPGHTISENLTLIRDLIGYVDRADMPLALLSLDQEKAFDHVDWDFLHR